jgi:mono/diheme cytochrome c family protein
MIFNKLYFLISPVLLGFVCAGLADTVLKEADQAYLIPVKIQEKSNLQASINRGKDIYTDFCLQCHLATGKGDLVNFPPLDGSDWLSKMRKESIHAVKYGQTGVIIVKGKKFNNIMPELGLENQEVADVMNYIMNSWSNKQKKMVTVEEVKAVVK